MITKTTLRPGQKGTKRLAEKYGDRLICVRYKYDERTERRYITVELIEEGADWASEPKKAARPDARPPSQRLGIRVEYWETEVQAKIKAAGGIWRPRQKLWEMEYKDIMALGLESRIVAVDHPDS
jgi:hypothetical protein